jgi:hypothetical protein
MPFCSDFELEALEELPRNILASDPEKKAVNAFILTLAVAFNDLKGIFWVAQQLVNGRPENPDINEYCGQWSGLNLQTKRLAVGIFYELLCAINKNRTTIAHPDFQEALNRTGPKARGAWLALIAIDDSRAEKKGIGTRVVGLVKKVRNEITFHYYQPENFLKGYEQWLATDTATSKFAYASFGKTWNALDFISLMLLAKPFG